MSMISVTDLTFAYDGSYDNIFEHVSFQIDTDWKLGFIGRNGRGKTTFLKLLMGTYEYSGRIASGVEFEYFPYPVNNQETLTSDIVNEIYPEVQDWRIFKELNLLDVDPEVLYRPFSTLSNGERTKVLLAALFLKEHAFLLIDEPTNHLDVRAREKVADYLNTKKGFILVSHDRTFLDGCIDHVLSINRTDIEVQKGNFSSWYANKEAQDKRELARNEHLKKDIHRLEESARQAGRWSDKVEQTRTGTRTAGLKPDRGHVGHMAAKLMKRSKSIEGRQKNAVQEKKQLLKNTETLDDLKLTPLRFHSDKLVSLKNICIAYNKIPVCSAVNLEIHQGERICLCGRNGCGKSSLIRLILGKDVPYTGEFWIAPGLRISYISQDTSWMSGTLKDFAEQYEVEETLLMTVLRKLGFERTQFEKGIEDFSEGQKKKVLLAKSLCEKAHLFIWDEPLNFIDLFSRLQLEELLLEYKPTLLFVEHDQAFADKTATRVLHL